MVPAVTVKVPVVAPAATVAEAGTVREALLLASDTAAPPAGAALLSVTVHAAAAPEERVEGLHATEETTVAAASEMVAFAEDPFQLAVTRADASAAIVPAVALKVAVVAPAATVAEAGTVREALLLASDIAAPPAGAALLSVTVQAAAAPEERVAGAHCRPLIDAAVVRPMDAVREFSPTVAVTTAVWSEVTVAPVAAKVRVAAPPLTVTLAGTVNAGLLLASATVTPPAGAGEANVTVQVEVAGTVSVPGEQVRDASDGRVPAGAETVIAPALPASAIVFPSGVLPIVFTTLTGTVPEADAESVTLRVATTPLAIAVAFMPESTQLYPAFDWAQLRLFAAAVPAAPAVADTAVTLAAG
jgi:hypothetical protein